MMHDGAPSRPRLPPHLRLPLKSKPSAEAVSRSGSKNQILIMSQKGQKDAGVGKILHISAACVFKGFHFSPALQL